MAESIPDAARHLFEKPNFAHVATLSPDGTPQVTPVWIDIDGDTVIFNTARGREKDKNLQRDPRVGISIHDQENPYESVSVQGQAVELTEEGADEHIDAMAQQYLGEEAYPFRQEGEVRVIVRIEADSVFHGGG
ncbi:MAG: PPOX class F420-dependent oxidoreductase [Solirubrobacterales bacterium]